MFGPKIALFQEPVFIKLVCLILSTKDTSLYPLSVVVRFYSICTGLGSPLMKEVSESPQKK